MKNTDIKVAGILRQDTGVGYYRVGQPILFIDKISSKKSRITPFTGQNQAIRLTENISAPGWTDKTLMEIADGADVIWSTMLFAEDEIIKMLDLRKWSGAKWVVDIDDNMYAVSRDNPASKQVNQLLPTIELCLHAADGITVSTPYLANLYKPLNDKMFINPNGIDFEWFKHRKGGHKGIRIGWRGAYGHDGDILLAKPAIDALSKEYDITFVTLGKKPNFKTEHHEWVNFLDFPKKLDSLDLDIAVVPLVDSEYNKGKSNLAILEYSALKIPVVGSPVENQKNMPISYASTNYEWYQELEKMIKSADLRKKQAKNQSDFVKKHYSMPVLTPNLVDFFKKLPRKDI